MEDASVASLLLRLAVSMGVVIALMLMAARVLRRTTGRGGGPGRRSGRTRRTPINLEVIQPLTKAAHVAIVRAAGRELVLGVTDHQITLLHSAIEPRDTAVDLDVTTRTTTQALDLDSAHLAQQPPAPAGTRTVPAATEVDAPTGQAGVDDTSGQSAWTDALELLREKTVRR